MENQVEYEVFSLPAAVMLQHRLPSKVVTSLNEYLDSLRSNELRESASDTLVGQIHQGEQLKMNFKDQELATFVSIVEHLGMAYLKHFVELTKSPLRPKKISIDKLWSVHSFEGDYNPIHDHLTESNMGISFTTWTMVPEQIHKPDEEAERRYELYNSSGAIDGFINFTYGLNQVGDPERLRPPQSRYVKPEPGKLLLFPSWMQHCVYPFFGDGERRTVAGNLNCFNLTQSEIEEIKKNERV
tara:strand:+ start:961 stop:1686 length:726 start_codon:yes stop_codon:yes gene_type:complete